MNASKPEADKDMEKKKFLTKWLHAISLEISSNHAIKISLIYISLEYIL